jgi:hypothetical protein
MKTTETDRWIGKWKNGWMDEKMDGWLTELKKLLYRGISENVV